MLLPSLPFPSSSPQAPLCRTRFSELHPGVQTGSCPALVSLKASKHLPTGIPGAGEAGVSGAFPGICPGAPPLLGSRLEDTLGQGGVLRNLAPRAPAQAERWGTAGSGARV